MPKIYGLIYRAVIPPFLISCLVLTFVVFLHDLGRLSELLITRNASAAVIAMIVATVLPGILIFSLPLSYLVGMLIGLSGLSGESQIIALRACGVPLRRLLRPILPLGIMVGCLTATLSLLVLPETNNLLRVIRDRVSLRQATSQVRPRVFNEDFPGVVFYMDDLTPDRQQWSRVFLVDSSNPGSQRVVLARHGTWITDMAAQRMQLHLEQGKIYEVNLDDPSKDNVSVFAATDIPIEISRNNHDSPDKQVPIRPLRPSEMRTRDLFYGNPAGADIREGRIELHRRLAVPLAILPFSLLSLTLGISTRRGGRAYGFVLSLFLVLLFYVLFFNGLRLASIGKLSPWLGAWEANILLTLLGLALLAVSERLHIFGRGLPGLNRLSPGALLGRQGRRAPDPSRSRRMERAIGLYNRSLARLRVPKVLDVYISRGFLHYFLWSIVVCGTLFVVLTLFDLLDDIIRNEVPFENVVNYIFFLTPHILMLAVPMSILLAILIHFGILEKNTEVTALKAGGWSLYRVAAPVFLLAAFFCASLYLLQDYVVPYANIRQDALRNSIKGRPAQTSMRPQRKWIVGEANRIFNYDYFDANQSRFVGLNVFEVDLHNLTILNRIHAERATIEDSGSWELQNGWIRNFQSGREDFHIITKTSLSFPERATYFQKEVFEPRESSKLSYLELRKYISYLSRSGYNATELQVELYRKISFPLSCLVMALIGVPFSFFTGKKGAFFGITASVAIAISYWGVNSVFEQMGAYGLLVPLLAAWAPNILFASAGLALLFTIRT